MRDNAGVEQRRTPSGSSVAACVESLDTAELLLRSAGVPQGGRLEGQGLAEQVAQGAACAAGPSASLLDLPHRVPKELQAGEPMLKVTSKKVMQRNFRLDADRGQILWDSKKQNKGEFFCRAFLRSTDPYTSSITVNLESICEVRWASAAAAYRSSLSISPSHEPRWVSIIYQRSGEYKALHLIALSDESLARWKTGLEVLQSARCALLGLDTLGDGSGSQGKESVWLRQQWKDADSQTQDEKLDLNEIFKLCKRLGIQSSRADLQRRFQGADQQKKGYLDFAAFQHFVKLLKRRSELELLFNCYSQSHLVTCETGQTCQTKDTSHPMTREAFRRFLQDEQRVSDLSAHKSLRRVVLDEGQLDRLYDRHADLESSLLTLEGFSNFLLSADNSAILDTTRNSYQDMERPLYDYYISSSHNTYLVGGQWKGDSTVEGYVRALQQGARSVELDCWDGSNNTPQITHGRTLTGKVAFADVIAAIEKYAFAKSPYPLILSMEIHNDIAQQDVMAQILRETLKDKLLTERLATCKNPDGLPSPEELKGKVLIKAKNLIVAEAERARAEAAGESKAEAWHAPSEDYSASDDTTGSDDGLALNLRERASPFGSHFSSRHPEERQPRKVLMSTALASLLIYTVGVKSRGINKKEVYAPEHMISFSERTAFKYVRSAPDDLIKHNRSHLSRIYPSMSSIARLHQSANFLPHHLWAIGCQLVALNWQTADLGMELNQAMFIRNGRCGYVLKPEGLREKELVKSKGQRIRLAVDLDIISAQQLPRSRDATRDATKEKDKDEEADIISPSVSVTLLAPQSWGPQPATRTPATSRMSELVESVTARLQTDVVRNNGFNPIWNAKLSVPIEVPAETSHQSQSQSQGNSGTNANAPAIASYTACVGALQEGYRHLPLYDCHLTQHLFSTLFVRIRFRLVGVRGPEQEAQK
ncbi:PLC-like phosphodiesterase [Tilletiaria anomala UBC 951]|uniref:Phosphoinositide phospholipase C n=1 Tax=Tilletiaria anomala (strain ATCC 24038 / CBS 436.72 / UBC 951) TaxID=1037660 RepID=A0A066WDY6_TILAU|nr:PLC-like phosphodiesterase [Tilletiaria anomala UBC 951]KDN52167.1 PLC-like phosphodiesterase [Tilletiaria anomala UBC 951]